jgi:hypothetical protein
MKRVLILADSKNYIHNNCFQLQLHKTIKVYSDNIKIEYFYLSPKRLRDVKSFKVHLKSYDFVLSTLRQRVLFNNTHFLQRLIGDLPLKIYDQDPWENYIDDSQSNGCYSMVNDQFHLKEIFVTSNFWKGYIEKNDEIKTTFVQMGMLPELCSTGLLLSARPLKVEFRGTLRPHRERFFAEVRSSGQEIKINTEVLSYMKYLKYLRRLAIFVHDESGYWVCKGERIPMSTGMWVKDIEIASQGCFSIRNYDPECESYSVDKIPLVQFYREPREVKEIIAKVSQFSINELNEIQQQSVEFIKSTNNWLSTVHKIFGL